MNYTSTISANIRNDNFFKIKSLKSEVFMSEKSEKFQKFNLAAAQEACVLLKNQGETLPLLPQDKVSVFGRAAFDFIASGLGSGGSVHVPYKTVLMEELLKISKESGNPIFSENLVKLYKNWRKENPFDNGSGVWAGEPFSQKDLPLTSEIVNQEKKFSNKAIYVISRNAGEDKDLIQEKGSWFLSDTEYENLKKICEVFEKVCVVFNSCSIIDTSFASSADFKNHITALLYVWQGGMEAGKAAANVLCAKDNLSVCGKLSDTIAKIQDYPSTKNFGQKDFIFYQEDIYVGYRYFLTFAREKILFPFGFGLSYTSFDVKFFNPSFDDKMNFSVKVQVQNSGTKYSGKEVVQLYLRSPQGKLGKASRVLVAFKKTPLLAAGEKCELELTFNLKDFASYDDSENSKNAYSWILEKGKYFVYGGIDSLSAKKLNSCFKLSDDFIVEKLEQSAAPTKSFKRIKPKLRDSADFADSDSGTFAGKTSVSTENSFVKSGETSVSGENFSDKTGDFSSKSETCAKISENFADENYKIQTEDVPLSKINLEERIKKNLPKDITFTGNQNLSFEDLKSNLKENQHLDENLLDKFVAQLNPQELATIVRGEGMMSSKVTMGVTSAFGGLSESLHSYKIPVACTADGPSGIRIDTGKEANLMPTGTCLACTWNPELVGKLYFEEGAELLKNQIDTLLGPGMNIHRNPLNGRNFEYFSEDPLLTAQIASAEMKSLHKAGSNGTCKHFACNSQELCRNSSDSIVSERALREIYLKAFEISVKNGSVHSLMTSYNAINGHWAASNYDTVNTILHKEWGYKGLVMTDWWAKMNNCVKGGEATVKNAAYMIKARNDVYMIVDNDGAEINEYGDNIQECLENGELTLGELQLCVKDILTFILKSPVSKRPLRELKIISNFAPKISENEIPKNAKIVKEGENFIPNGNTYFYAQEKATFNISGTYIKAEDNLSQSVTNIFIDQVPAASLEARSTAAQETTVNAAQVILEFGFYKISLENTKPGLEVKNLCFTSKMSTPVSMGIVS